MNANSALTVVLAVTVLVGGVAAAGAATPGGQAADTPDEANNSSAADRGNAANGPPASDVRAAGNGSEAGNASAVEPAGDAGPPNEMPTPVPDRVGAVHQKIDAFLDGDLDDLGAELSGLLSPDEATAADGADA